ncbi:MAG: nucleotidyl transferase AbiEii/AbiGii toxin family protein [Oscillospiraceae bacterium]|nr:nucleotidyl transferase AbiEii/AbiGii toxin family protein [Oscillospiraceae bacterium]
MVLRGYLVEWNEVVPWSNMHQVEQDLIIGRVLVEIYKDEFLSKCLAFRGGTAIHRLFLTQQARYSEDIDLVQMVAEPIGPTLDKLREVLSFLGTPVTQRKASNNTMIYKIQSTFPPETPLKLKIEINCKEHFSVLGYKKLPYEIANTWFSGKCELVTFDFNELLGTKLRALYQRRKGRDLFDLFLATSSPLLHPDVAIECFRRYITFSDGKAPSKEVYIRNLEDKMKVPQFLKDMDGIIRPGIEYDPSKAFEIVKEVFLKQMTGCKYGK